MSPLGFLWKTGWEQKDREVCVTLASGNACYHLTLQKQVMGKEVEPTETDCMVKTSPLDGRASLSHDIWGPWSQLSVLFSVSAAYVRCLGWSRRLTLRVKMTEEESQARSVSRCQRPASASIARAERGGGGGVSFFTDPLFQWLLLKLRTG